jgi:hypothetical protein
MVLKRTRDFFRERACRLGPISIDLLLQIEPRRQVVNMVTSNLKGVKDLFPTISLY